MIEISINLPMPTLPLALAVLGAVALWSSVRPIAALRAVKSPPRQPPTEDEIEDAFGILDRLTANENERPKAA